MAKLIATDSSISKAQDWEELRLGLRLPKRISPCPIVEAIVEFRFDTSIPDEATDLRARGFRFYDTSPYILVKTNNQGGLTSEVKYLPDLTKKRSARPYAFLSSNDTKLTFGGTGNEGLTLTQGVSDAKADAVPAAIAEATPVVPEVDGRPAKAPPFALFKVVKRDGQWGIIGASNQPVNY